MDDQIIELPPESVPSAVDQAVATPQKVEALTRLSGSGGLVQSPKSQAVLELEATGIRGGGMILLHAMMTGLEEDVRRARAETIATEKEMDTWKTKYFSEREKAAVLRERIHALARVKLLQNIFLSIGGVFLGLGAKLMLESKEGLGAVFLALAAVFLFAGWLWPTGFRNEETSK
jgi:hypothetical protein